LVFGFPGTYGGGVADVLWASPSGVTLLATAEGKCAQGNVTAFGYRASGIIARGTLRSLTFPAGGLPFAGEAAF
jgi:hypothetical protein